MGEIFHIGDRVKCADPDHEIGTPRRYKGQIGTVVSYYNSFCGKPVVAVEYDNKHDNLLHNCDGRVESHMGWFHFEHELEMVMPYCFPAVSDLL